MRLIMKRLSVKPKQLHLAQVESSGTAISITTDDFSHSGKIAGLSLHTQRAQIYRAHWNIWRISWNEVWPLWNYQPFSGEQFNLCRRAVRKIGYGIKSALMYWVLPIEILMSRKATVLGRRCLLLPVHNIIKPLKSPNSRCSRSVNKSAVRKSQTYQQWLADYINMMRTIMGNKMLKNSSGVVADLLKILAEMGHGAMKSCCPMLTFLHQLHANVVRADGIRLMCC